MAAAIFVNAESLKKMKMTTGLDWSEVASLTADELITVFFLLQLKKIKPAASKMGFDT